MIPPFEPGSGVLPLGIHPASIVEVEGRFTGNPIRDRLFRGLRQGLALLEAGGCRLAYVDGSFVTAKANPGDFDVAWDARGVDPMRLDPIFWWPIFVRAPRSAQKLRFGGEFMPAQAFAEAGITYLDFFQRRKEGGMKGIVAVGLGGGP